VRSILFAAVGIPSTHVCFPLTLSENALERKPWTCLLQCCVEGGSVKRTGRVRGQRRGRQEHLCASGVRRAAPGLAHALSGLYSDHTELSRSVPSMSRALAAKHRRPAVSG